MFRVRIKPECLELIYVASPRQNIDVTAIGEPELSDLYLGNVWAQLITEDTYKQNRSLCRLLNCSLKTPFPGQVSTRKQLK